MKTKIAITIGDVNGIGPEVILKAFVRSPLFAECVPILYGPPDVLEYYNRHLGGIVPLRRIGAPEEAEDSILNVIPDGEPEFLPGTIGMPTERSGGIALRAIRQAAAACMEESVDAMVTAPISKEAIARAGSLFHGHTEMLAALAGATGVIMILAADTMRVGLATIHVPVREVAPLITADRVLATIRNAHRALTTDFAIERPLLAVLGLNPHAGDGGVLGTEEAEAIIPAVRTAREEGIRARGPFAADGFFSAHQTQLYDMIVAMYHDQGLIPLKMQARGRGVNITCGLPFVRTSPDHGTAYDIAGKMIAKPDSMREAILQAVRLAKNRKAAISA